MNQIKKFQTAPGALPAPKKQSTYYGGYPVTHAEANYYTPEDGFPDYVNIAEAKFDDGSEFGYDVSTYTYPEGDRSVHEYGTRNGVLSQITNMYDQNGRVYHSDTTYNGLRHGDIGYEQLQRQFEGSSGETQDEEQPILTQTQPRWKQVAGNVARFLAPGATALVKVGQKAAQVGKSRMKQGGYLRLQKQGGKLTEVWTPFN